MDAEYKRLFAQPELIRDLLQEYIPGDWVRAADFSTLERVNSSYVADQDRQRHDDMVWRLKVGEQWLWVYLLLEFQGTPDRWMAVRLLVYVVLLAQDLIRQGELVQVEKKGKRLPPIVLYNGLDPWQMSLEVAECLLMAAVGSERLYPAGALSPAR